MEDEEGFKYRYIPKDQLLKFTSSNNASPD